MLVSVVEVGNVRVRMDEFAMFVDVAVPSDEAVRMRVVVVSVAMFVLVRVVHDVMVVLVKVS